MLNKLLESTQCGNVCSKRLESVHSTERWPTQEKTTNTQGQRLRKFVQEKLPEASKEDYNEPVRV